MYYEEIKEWTSRLDVKYNAEGLGNISLKVLETLLRPKRNTISKEERDKIIKSQNGRCAVCGEQSTLEMDHIIPVSRGGTDLQGLCAECHSHKSCLENQSSRSWQPLTSVMNKAAYKSFCSGKTKPLNLVCREIKNATFSVDLIKCRTNALRFNFPSVFSLR